MNKNEIKQIILEEIEAALQEMNENMTPEDMAADSRPEEDDEIEGPGWEDMPGAKVHPFVGDQESRIARAMETGDEDELEDLAAGELDRAGLEEMARTANVFALSQTADMEQILQFMFRVNDKLKTYKSPGQKRPKKRFTRDEMKALAAIMVRPEGFTSKDIIAATSYNSPAQANKFLAALEQKGLIKLTSQLKKAQEPTRDPNAPETRGRKAKSAEFDIPDDALDMDFGDFEDLDLGDIGALEESILYDSKFDHTKNPEHLKAVTEVFRQISNVLFSFRQFSTHKVLKYHFINRGHDTTDDEQRANYDNILKTPLHIILQKPGAYDYSRENGGDAMEYFYKSDYSKYKTLYNFPRENDLKKYSRQELAEAIMGAMRLIRAIKGSVFPSKVVGKKYTAYQILRNEHAENFQNSLKKLESANKALDNLFENNTMSELKKYIKQQIKEAKNPLAKKMKEIENQGRIAALETKLAAVAEMIEETNGRLTRIDEDNEFADMMDKNAVKEVRKQLKELERAQAKLQKEYDKAAGGRRRPKPVVDEDEKSFDEKTPEEMSPEDTKNLALSQAGIPEEFKLNESTLRMQKLAGLKG